MVDVGKLTKKRLGEILKEQGLITQEHIEEALERQEETDELMGRALIEMGHVTEQDIARVLCTQFGLPFVDVGNCAPNKDLIEEIPDSFIKEYNFLPLDKIGKIVVIAVSGVFDQDFFETLQDITDSEIQLVISTRKKIEQALVEHLEFDPHDFDIDDAEDHIEREPEEKDVKEPESEIVDLSQEAKEMHEPEPVGSEPSDDGVEKTKTFTLDENDEGEPVIDLESEAERIFEETEEELEKEKETSSDSAEQDTEEEEAEEDLEETEEASSTEQQAGVSS